MDTLYFICPVVFLVLTVAYWINIDIGKIHSKDIMIIQMICSKCGKANDYFRLNSIVKYLTFVKDTGQYTVVAE